MSINDLKIAYIVTNMIIINIRELVGSLGLLLLAMINMESSVQLQVSFRMDPLAHSFALHFSE